MSISDGQFQQNSFVNSIATTTGGTHVNHVADQIVKDLVDHVRNLLLAPCYILTGQVA